MAFSEISYRIECFILVEERDSVDCVAGRFQQLNRPGFLLCVDTLFMFALITGHFLLKVGPSDLLGCLEGLGRKFRGSLVEIPGSNYEFARGVYLRRGDGRWL
jgi:hypothetical protein